MTVAQVLPLGKDITVKSIVKNAPFVIQYMELKSMSKLGERRQSLEHFAFDLVGDCLQKKVECSMDSNSMVNDSQYFELQGNSGSYSGFSVRG